MRLRTFTAPDMPAAMKMVRETLGDSAVILSADSNKGKNGVTVTAAMEVEEEFVHASIARSKPAPDQSKLDDIRFELQNLLRFHNIPELYIAKIMQKATSNALFSLTEGGKSGARHDENHLLRHVLEKIFSDYFAFEPLNLLKQDKRIMLVGPPGIGKTLTIAKMAAKLSMDKEKLVVITTDNKRAGGVEQLQAFTTILGVELVVAGNYTKLHGHIAELSPRTKLLIDTAGCNPYETKELTVLQDFSSIEGIEPILVLPAGGDSLESIDIVEAFCELPIKKLLVTRADTARRFGGILAAAASHNLALCNVSSSPSIVDPLKSLDGSYLAQLLLQYRQTQ